MPKVHGKVSAAREARVSIAIIGGIKVEATIDTGFDGALVLPHSIVEQMNLPIVGREKFMMVGGIEGEAVVALAQIEWLGEVKYVQVIVEEDYLIGTELLDKTQLVIDYVAGTVTITAFANE